MSDLTVSLDAPGLHITMPDRGTPTATFACRCGFVRTGRGVDQAADVITGHPQHRLACQLRTEPEG